MKAKNIKWDVDIEDVYNTLDDMTAETAAAALEISADKYANMTTEERHDYAYDKLHRSPSEMAELLGLPNELEIPKELKDEDDISEWLSEKTGFCHNGFEITKK